MKQSFPMPIFSSFIYSLSYVFFSCLLLSFPLFSYLLLSYMLFTYMQSGICCSVISVIFLESKRMLFRYKLFSYMQKSYISSSVRACSIMSCSVVEVHNTNQYFCQLFQKGRRFQQTALRKNVLCEFNHFYQYTKCHLLIWM